MPCNLSCPSRSSSAGRPFLQMWPLLSGGPSGSSLPSECFWAYMAHPTISFSSLPWVREVSGSSVYKAQSDTYSSRALFTPSAGLCCPLVLRIGPPQGPHCSSGPLVVHAWTTSCMLLEDSLECLTSALLGVGSGKGQTKPLFLSLGTGNFPSSP